MSSEGKRQFAMTADEREAKVVMWSSYTPQVQMRILLITDDAAAFLGVSVRVLEDARAAAIDFAKKVQAGENPTPLDPNKPSTIPFRDRGGMIRYTAYHLLEFLDRAEFGIGGIGGLGVHSGKSLMSQGGASDEETSPAQPQEPAWIRGLGQCARSFMTWMQTTDAAATWPFSIQEDGRPFDLHTAMMEGKLTGKAERLNIREYGERLANAASEATAIKEADEIGIGLLVPPAQGGVDTI